MTGSMPDEFFTRHFQNMENKTPFNMLTKIREVLNTYNDKDHAEMAKAALIITVSGQNDI